MAIDPKDQTELRASLEDAAQLADTYDGSERALTQLVAKLSVAEAFARAHGGIGDLKESARERMEEAFFRSVNPGFGSALSINGFLDRAQDHYATSLKQIEDINVLLETLERSGSGIVRSPFCFVRTESGALQPPETGAHKYEVKTEPRLQWLLAAMNANGIYTDDLIIHMGTVDPRMMRKSPYVLIEIPRYGKEIAVCNQSGEITFISHEIIGPPMWASLNKDELKARPTIETIEMTNPRDWTAEIIAHIKSTEPLPKIDVQALVRKRPKAFPLTEDFIALHAWRHYEAHEKKFPTADSGPIDNLPGEIWGTWNMGLVNGFRTLPRGSSLHKLYIKKGWMLGDLTEDIIAEHAWKHYKNPKHGELPGQGSGPVDDLPGETWRAWDQALRKGGRNLPGGSSLHKLYIKKGWMLGELTEDIIADYAWRHYKAHGEFPGAGTGAVDGLPGETWAAWESALQKGHRTLTAGSSLWRLYIKKGWRLDNLTEEIIAAYAWCHYKAHEEFPNGDMGSVDDLPAEMWSAWDMALIQGDRTLPGGSSLKQLYINKGWRLGDLTEEIIAEHAWKHYKKHKKFPIVRTGAVDDLPGETWAAWDLNLRGGHRTLPGGSSLYQLLAPLKERARRERESSPPSVVPPPAPPPPP